MIQNETEIENKPETKPLDNKEKPLIRCNICGSKMWRNNYRRHIQSKKHCDALYVMQDMFEIK
jgi:hypothetical protein